MVTDNRVRVDAVELPGGDRQAVFAMMSVLMSMLTTLRGLAPARAALYLEILALSTAGASRGIVAGFVCGGGKVDASDDRPSRPTSAH